MCPARNRECIGPRVSGEPLYIGVCSEPDFLDVNPCTCMSCHAVIPRMSSCDVMLVSCECWWCRESQARKRNSNLMKSTCLVPLLTTESDGRAGLRTECTSGGRPMVGRGAHGLVWQSWRDSRARPATHLGILAASGRGLHSCICPGRARGCVGSFGGGCPVSSFWHQLV